MVFETAGIEIAPWFPPIVTFFLAFLGSMAGVSGAFLLMPFQMSVLGFTSPAVSPTNLLYNVVATPAGVFRYIREKRMFWPLTVVMLVGEIPGLILGVYVRLTFLPDPAVFKVFVGCVLLLLAASLLRSLFVSDRKRTEDENVPGWGTVRNFRVGLRRMTCQFEGQTHAVPVPLLLLVSFAVGTMSAIYGIGGGAILVPLLLGVFKLPVYIVAGSALATNFVASAVGIITYQFIAPLYTGTAIAPDWKLGFLFGVGGVAGMYAGARCQKYVPSRWIKTVLLAAVLFVAIRYLVGAFLGIAE